MRSAIFLVVLVALAAAWRWTPLGSWLDVAMLVEGARPLRDHPFTPLLVIGVYAVGGLVVAPITGLIIASAMAFGPLLGFAYSLLGCLVSAAITYGIGSRLGRETMRRVAARSSTPDEEGRAQLPDDKSDAPTRYVRGGFL